MDYLNLEFSILWGSRGRKHGSGQAVDPRQQGSYTVYQQSRAVHGRN